MTDNGNLGRRRIDSSSAVNTAPRAARSSFTERTAATHGWRRPMQTW
ncbi:hypothetical protein [Sporisorium scitamineum]|uniref:Uncharacterized protein n=1 Tax=Sporisorium scitamineum TaxID=49012 RepID=A0A0F7S605_9BASI|nr:hypothetical protein [Sporisorium scitamineum]